ncbi:cation diffusion facilitator family transporter [Thioalkalivibrio thiocyanodenitrificans]|uniref:cation diffusion facilitator family transporter n=1 Tax=Thioalkalivibrio thiocyanodenitrificans TaxID=243063 RepID=UPI000372541A|nr:cation diffusion facilitator family transporter [Thioalkalivibrio thiocyanodenitrificans]
MNDASELIPGKARKRSMRRVTLTAAATNLFLSAAQIVGGVFTQSQALIADGVHTLSDLVSDGVVLLAGRHANVAPDSEHPYGHARIETLATVAVGLLLTGAAVTIGMDAGRRLFEPERLLSPEPLALVFAVLAIVLKEGLYRYTMRVARRIRSNLLKANAWHHRSDVISSLVVLAGVGGTLAGLPYLDAVAAVVVAALIAHMGGRLIWDSARELIDTGLGQERVARIRDTILAVEGVKGVHMLRTRRMAGTALADVHILVSPRISISEGHQVSERVRLAVTDAFEELIDVTVHIDPEDDERLPPALDLPGRTTVLAALHREWAEIPESRHMENVVLHYLGGRIHVELYLPRAVAEAPEAAARLAGRLREASKRVPEVGEVVVYFREDAQQHPM